VILFFLSLVIIIVVSVIVYRLGVRIALYKSSDDPESSTRKNGESVAIECASIYLLRPARMIPKYDFGESG
jgi:hypothetical protein